MRKGVILVLGVLIMKVGSGTAEIVVDGEVLSVTTSKLKARFQGAALVSLIPRDATTEFLHPEAPAAPIDLVYLNGETLGKDKHQSTTVRKISDLAARIEVQGADSDRSILVRIDSETGDLCITPDGLSARRGVRSVRWNMAFHPDSRLVLPCVNGILVQPNREFPRNDWFEWPFRWNAQLVIAEKDDFSLMVHAEDTLQRFKGLNLARSDTRTELGFDSQVPGPAWDNRTAGGIEWRISVSPGDWHAPAGRYRDWLRRVHGLEQKRTSRPEWVDSISLVQCWAPPNMEMLDALAEVHPPEETLIHLSNWRTEKYDVNYPDYTPTEEAITYVKKAKEMGFHVMPHFNYFAVFYQHPFYQKVRDFQIRSIDKNEPMGWHWPPDTHDYTRMGYIHPGLGIWRRKLIDVVLEACDRLETDIAFIDQTLCTWNTDNGLIQGLSTVGGLSVLQEEFHRVRPDLVLVGEGLNEVSFVREAFAQAHIHDGWGDLAQHHVEAAHPICSFLWEGHTRLVGYYHHLNPGNKNVDLCIEVYRRMGAIPTIVTKNPDHLRDPGDAAKRILELAKKEGKKK
jgi:hypothetical protein